MSARLRSVALAGLAALVACTLPTACSTDITGGTRLDDLRLMVPNAPGGGYDTTARIAAQALETEGLTDRVEVFNVEGASGVVGLTRTSRERGNPDLLMMMGLGVVGALHTTRTTSGLDHVTPIARLISEPEAILVPKGSRFTSLGALLKAWRAHPDQIRVGGGSSPGGPDHLASYLLAKAIGIDPGKVRYQQYDGGGPLIAALFSGSVDFALSGVGENANQYRTGQLQVLAVTGKEQVADFDAPTLRELGVKFDFANWRGVVAPPGLTEDERQSLIDLVTKLHDSKSWHAAERANGWTDDFVTGRRFGDFLRAESTRVADVLDSLGIGPA